MHDATHSFGYWLRRRRKALDLTQEALAQRVSCSHFSIRKIEADERRPSRALAARLAVSLAIPENELDAFLVAARSAHAKHGLSLRSRPLDANARDEQFRSHPSPLQPEIPPRDATAPFVGRNAEYGLLTGLVTELAAGAGHTVLIEGEPGIGKSRLMREVVRYADDCNVATLTTNCYEIDRAIPYQPVVDLVMRALDCVPTTVLGNLSTVSLAELECLIPQIGERFPGLPSLSNDFPEARQARLCVAVGQLLETLRSDSALMLVVDDIQWADDASAQVFHYLARQALKRPMLVVYAYRDEAIDSDERFASLVESLQRDTAARRVRLNRLARSDTESLVIALADSTADVAGLAERLYRETEGNPFFLVSILQSLCDGETTLEPPTSGESGFLPDALRVAVRARLAHVPKELRPTLETAAVLGRRFDFDTLVNVTGASEASLLGAIEALVKRRLLHDEGDAGVFDFSHDKVREVVYSDIGGTRRRLIHQSVAEALERGGESETHERDAQLAEHYERAHVWPKALQYLVLAGERSRKLFSMRDALHWLDRAVALAELYPKSLDDIQRSDLYERRGTARAQAGQTHGAVADCRRVVDAARAAGDRARTRAALVQLGMAYRRADAHDEATACLTEALAESRAMNDERHAADTLYHLGTVAWSTGRNDRALEFHQQAVELCDRIGSSDLVAVQAYHGRGEAYFANAEPAAAIDCFTRSLALARGIGDKSYESENLMMIGHACLGTKGLGDYPRAIANFEAAREIARTADLQWHLGPTLLGLDHALACTGNYGRAWSGIQSTLRWLEGLKQTRYQLIAYDFLGHLLLDLDLNELVIEHVQIGQAVARDAGIMFWGAALDTHIAVARSRLGQDDVAPALQATLEQTRRTSERYLMVRCMEGLAEIALATGETRRCRSYGDELLAIAEPNGLRELEASARRWRGKAMYAEHAFEQASIELSRAGALAEEIGRVRLQIDVQSVLANLLSQQGQRAGARKHDAKARAVADTLAHSLVKTELEAPFLCRSS